MDIGAWWVAVLGVTIKHTACTQAEKYIEAAIIYSSPLLNYVFLNLNYLMGVIQLQAAVLCKK